MGLLENWMVGPKMGESTMAGTTPNQIYSDQRSIFVTPYVCSTPLHDYRLYRSRPYYSRR